MDSVEARQGRKVGSAQVSSFVWRVLGLQLPTATVWHRVVLLLGPWEKQAAPSPLPATEAGEEAPCRVDVGVGMDERRVPSISAAAGLALPLMPPGSSSRVRVPGCPVP